jgi:hypothetical protein
MLAEGGHSWAEISAKTGEGFLALLGARIRVCFPAGTQVTVGQSVNAQGQIEYRTTAIETLKAGDFVLAREEFGPAVKPQPILATYERQSNHLVMISLRDRFGRTQTITTTDDHPFWVVELAAYLKPQDLREGMSVIGPNEERQSVIAVHREDHPEWVSVYNLKVDQFHTYFVSQSTDNLPVLVHNTNGITCAEAAAPRSLLHENPSGLVKSRVGELTTAICDGAKSRITMGVAVVEDANGVRSVLVSTSEPRGYLRRGVTLKPGETMVVGTGHAEADLVAYAKANNLKIVDVGATRRVCVPCQDALGPTGANISTPLRKRPK